MAVFFGDGFDLYSTITDCGGYWDSTFGGTVTLAISSTGRFTGSRGLAQAAGASATPYITKVSGSNDAVHHIVAAIQQTTALTGTNNGLFFTLYDGSTAQCTVVFRSDGAILLQAGALGGATLATYAGAVSAVSTWFQFEIEVVINNTTGSFKVRKNGNTSDDHSTTSLDTQASANAYANKIGVGSFNGSAAQVLDDFLWRSDTASVAWVGDVRCYTRMPLGDSSVQWTPSGSVVPQTPYTQVSAGTPSTTTARFSMFLSPCNGTISNVTLTLNAANAGNVKCSIFASSGYWPIGIASPTVGPTTVLGSASTLTGLSAGANVFTFPTPVTVTQGTNYWVGFMTDTAAANSWGQSGTLTGQQHASTTYAAFPVASPTVSIVTSLIFTASIIPTATNAPFVGEAQQDAAATYVYSSTNGHADLYTIGSIASTPITILGVTTRGYFQKSDAGTRNATVQLKSGSTTVQGTSTALGAGSWTWIARNDLTDPATSAAWTATGVNNALIGPIVTA